MDHYDWVALKHEYVTDPKMTLRKMAAKHHINYRSVADRSRRDGWFAARKKHQSRVASKAINRTGDLQARELAKESEFLELMKGHMDRMLHDEMQFQRHLVEEKEISDESVHVGTSEKIFSKFDSRAMKDTMQVLQMMETMTRSLYNIQKAEAIQRRHMEAERLQIERERLELEKQRHEMNKPDTSTVIRIEGYEKGWDE